MYSLLPKEAVVVQKYGGTSVGTVERIRSIAARIAGQYRSGRRRLVIVVSAQSGETNRLIGLIEQVSSHPPAKAYDMALAAGEQVSVALLVAGLHEQGVEAVGLLAYQLGIFTDSCHSRARIRSIRTDEILKAWESGKIPVIAGFQGVTDDLQITTLGRGGSDTSAVALAVALQAGFCEINTDVNGVYTTDPRLVPSASLIKELDYEVALEMASLGSKVLHPRCVELGRKYRIPLVVRNSFESDESERTRIMIYGENDQLESPLVSGITLDTNVAKVTLNEVENRSELIMRVFDTIAGLGVNVDIIVLNRDAGQKSMRLGFTVTQTETELVRKAMHQLTQEPGFSKSQLTIETHFAKVSVVGVGMRSHSGVAARTFQALSGAEIDIHMVSTSEIKISCLVEESESEKAVQCLHQEFFSQDS